MKERATTYCKLKVAGYTLIEIMIAVAILAIIAAVAIPTYRGYITTSREASARANIEPLRLAQEDHWLDNGTYVAGTWDPAGAKTLESGDLAWRPDGDDNNFVYTVTISGTDAFTISVTHVDGGSAEVCKPQADPCP